MNQTPPISTVLEELGALGAGLVAALMPVLLLSVPGIILFVLLPAILLLVLAVPLAVVGALIAGPPYLIARWARRRRHRAAPRPGDGEGVALAISRRGARLARTQ